MVIDMNAIQSIRIKVRGLLARIRDLGLELESITVAEPNDDRNNTEA